jgi:TRAP transporter TAXI family solute receptor
MRPWSTARRRLLCALATTPAWGLARATEAPLRLGTSTTGGGFSLYGQTLAEVLARQAGRPVLVALPTRGTTENLERLARGELELGLVQGSSAHQALQAGATSGLRVLFAMYPSPGMLAVPVRSTARRLEDLRGQPVVFGVATSGLVLMARQVYGGIGLDIDRDFQAIYVEQAGQAPALVSSGAAAGLWGGGEGWPGFLRLAESPGGARFIGPDAEQTRRILERHPFLQAMELPAGSYPGMNAPLATVGSWNLILARADLPDETGYAAARALHEAASALAAALPQAAMSTLAATLQASPDPALLHPGTLRLLREQGLWPRR